MADPLDEQLQRFVGGPRSPVQHAVDAVSLPAIRRWVEAMGDENPIYVDGDAARAAGRVGIVAPAAMLGVWTMAGYRATRAPQPNERRGVLGVLASAGFATTPGVGLRQDYLDELQPGDRVSATTTVTAVSPRKRTTRGDGYFVSQTTDFTHDRGLAGRQTLTVFAYRPEPIGRSSSRPPSPDGDTSESLPPLDITLDRLGVIACTTACNDFRAGHYDPDVARSIGFDDIFTDIPTTAGLVARFVTQSADRRTRLRSLDIRLGVPFFAGDTLQLRGHVVAAGDHTRTVRVTGRTVNGVHVSGEAVTR